MYQDNRMISEQRKSKLEKVAANRQAFSVILENVHDPHNIGAVMRTCDAVGVHEVFILYTDPRQKSITLNDLQSTSTGVKKWVKIHLFNNAEDCFKAVRKSYDSIFATHLNAEAKSIYKTDLTGRVALMFGNEHAGLTSEALKNADGNIIIPQVGMAQSLNISVACAVSLYETMRQRLEANMYKDELADGKGFNREIFETYLDTHKKAYLRGRLKSK